MKIKKLFYILVVAPQSFDIWFSLAISGYAFCSSHGGSQCGDIGHFILYGCLTDVRVVILASFPRWRVDNQLNLPVLDGVGNIGPALMLFQYGF